MVQLWLQHYLGRCLDILPLRIFSGSINEAFYESICPCCRHSFGLHESKSWRAQPNSYWNLRVVNCHKTLQDFQEAIQDGCKVCTLLWRSLLKEEISKSIFSSDFQIKCNVEYSGRRMLVLPAYRFEFRTSRDSFTKTFSLSSLNGNVTQYEITLILTEINTGLWKEFAQKQVEYHSSNADSNVSLQQARKWILDCVEKYQKCSPSGKPKLLPTRLLYVGFVGEQSIRLCCTMSLPQNTLYMTLSHCWGQVQVITLTQHSSPVLPLTVRQILIETRYTPPAFWAFNTSGSTHFALYKIQRKTGKRSH
jgi:hypothetical protein